MTPEEIRAYGSAGCRHLAKIASEVDGEHIGPATLAQTQLMMEATKLALLTELTAYVASISIHLNSNPAAVYGPAPQRSN